MSEGENDEEVNIGDDEGVIVPEIQLDDTGLSDEEAESEDYNPLPYAFILKDVYRRPLLISPEKLYKARTSCPPFHVLLDHTIAVLWCFYSRSGHHKLGTSQLHWAIQFLTGLHDRNNRYTPDVLMAIEDLEGALLDVAAAQNVDEIMNRKYPDLNESLRPFFDERTELIKRTSYDDFETDLLGQKSKQGSMYDVPRTIDISPQSRFYVPTRAEFPSIILSDILEEYPEVLEEMSRTMSEDVCSIVSEKKSIRLNESGASQDLMSYRRNLIENTIRQLEQIRNLDETLGSLRCHSDPASISKIKDMIKNDL